MSLLCKFMRQSSVWAKIAAFQGYYRPTLTVMFLSNYLSYFFNWSTTITNNNTNNNNTTNNNKNTSNNHQQQRELLCVPST